MVFRLNKALLLAGKKLRALTKLRAHHSHMFAHSHPPYS